MLPKEEKTNNRFLQKFAKRPDGDHPYHALPKSRAIENRICIEIVLEQFRGIEDGLEESNGLQPPRLDAHDPGFSSESCGG